MLTLPSSMVDFSRSVGASFTGSVFTNDSDSSAAPSAENTPRGSTDQRADVRGDGTQRYCFVYFFAISFQFI